MSAFSGTKFASTITSIFKQLETTIHHSRDLISIILIATERSMCCSLPIYATF